MACRHNNNFNNNTIEIIFFPETLFAGLSVPKLIFPKPKAKAENVRSIFQAIGFALTNEGRKSSKAIKMQTRIPLLHIYLFVDCDGELGLLWHALWKSEPLFLHEGPGALFQAIRAGTLTRQVITLA